MESTSQTRILDKPIARYAVAFASTVAAVLLRLSLSGILNNRVTYITFYPAVMSAAVLGGFGPGIVATILCAAVTDYWLLSPTGLFSVSSTGDVVGLFLFICMGVFMSAIAGLYRRSRDKMVVLQGELAKSESNKRLELLSDTASQLLQTDDPQGLVKSLCDRVMAELGCHAFFNFLVDEERGCLHLNAFAGIPDEVGKSIEWLDYGVAVCGCAARDGCRIVAEDILNTPDPRTELVKSFGIQAYACHPLLAEGGRVIGTLSFGSRTKTSFSDDDLALMKAVTDQVATAMGRIRMLRDAQQHARESAQAEERIRLAQDAAHAADWEWDLRTNEQVWSEDLWKLYGLEFHSCDASYEAWMRIVHPDDLAAAERATKQAALRKTELNIEYRVRLQDGGERWLMVRGRPVHGADGRAERFVGIVVDITDRKHHEQHEKEIEGQKREFYKRTIEAATDGKLVVSEHEDIEAMAGEACAYWEMPNMSRVAAVRDSAGDLAIEAGMTDERMHQFLGCVVEAAGNAVKHTGSGKASLHRSKDSLIFVVSDSGQGIGAMALPEVALTRGYSTAGTLGMGYKLMIRFADRVYLATGSDGTTVAIEMMLQEPPAPLNYGLPKQIVAWND